MEYIYDWNVRNAYLTIFIHVIIHIIIHHRWNTDYGPPQGFNFDDNSDPPVNDDPLLVGYDIKERADQFVAEMKQRTAGYKTNQIFATAGSDFQYSNANCMMDGG